MGLSGLEVTFLHFDYRFSVDIWSVERGLSIIFETPFVVTAPSGEGKVFDPAKNETLGPLLSLLHRPVTCFEAWSDGRCMLRFADGTAICGEPHPQFEAWEAHGKGDLNSIGLLCGPGGGSPWGNL
jgi:hypothetical protein